MTSTAFRLSIITALAAAGPLGAQPIISTATFQQGTAGYTGSLDRKIGPAGAGDANGADIDTDTTSYFIDGGASALNDAGARHGLLRFSNVASGIPAGAKVISATVDMITATVADAQSGGALNLYQLNTAFDGTSTWDGTFGGDGLAGNISSILGSFDRPAAGMPVSARADRAVESWLSGGTNFGFGIRSDRSTDGWSPNTTGAATVANRPKLTVNYTLDPLVNVASFRQGVGGYTGTADLRLDSAGMDQDGSTVEEVFLDGFDDTIATPSADQSYLVRFNGLNLGQYQEIHKAELVLVSGFASANADSAGPFHVHQVLRDWSTSSTYASFDSNGNPAVNGPVELQAGGVIAPAATTVEGMNDTEMMHIDVTSIVENWRAGQTNYGFYVGTPSPAEGGTNNGWQIFTTGAADASFRPELRIVGIRVPEPASGVMIVFSGLLLSGFKRRRRC
jgi:hypothetical protein